MVEEQKVYITSIINGHGQVTDRIIRCNCTWSVSLKRFDLMNGQALLDDHNRVCPIRNEPKNDVDQRQPNYD